MGGMMVRYVSVFSGIVMGRMDEQLEGRQWVA